MPEAIYNTREMILDVDKSVDLDSAAIDALLWGK